MSRPNSVPLTAQYPCLCGASHGQVLKLFNVNVIGPCPEITDDLLHFTIPYNEPGYSIKPMYIRVGEKVYQPKPEPPKKPAVEGKKKK